MFNSEKSSQSLPSTRSNRTIPQTIIDKPIRKATRTMVPTSDSDIEFDRPIRSRRRTTKQIAYQKTPFWKRFQLNISSIGWLICGVLMLRLVFMDRGIIDYYSMNENLQRNKIKLERIQQENEDLVIEIDMIMNNPSYQKKVTRDHLGVIAKDEFLVLFASDH